MTTLTERLRELETPKPDGSGRNMETLIAIALAQELHALLVECGPFIGDDQPTTEYYKMYSKLKNAGIV